jgi:hypothetical protein
MEHDTTMNEPTMNDLDVQREYRKQTNRRYRDAHKEEILAHLLEKITCECGVVLYRANKSKHTKTNKHMVRMMRAREAQHKT